MLAYNLKRMMNIFGIAWLIEAIGHESNCFLRLNTASWGPTEFDLHLLLQTQRFN